MTRRQIDALVFIESYIRDNKISPSYDEIAAALGLRSKNGIGRIIDALVLRGRITKIRGVARGIEIVKSNCYEIVPGAAVALESYCARTNAIPAAIIEEALAEYFLKRSRGTGDLG